MCEMMGVLSFISDKIAMAQSIIFSRCASGFGRARPQARPEGIIARIGAVLFRSRVVPLSN